MSINTLKVQLDAVDKERLAIMGSAKTNIRE